MDQVHGGVLVGRALKRQSIDFVFTLCGAQANAIYDGCLDAGIRVVDTRHQQSAGFAADAHGRVAGLAGVCIVSAGPGITNTLTALATAAQARSPLVCLAGVPSTRLDDLGAFQAIDSLALARPVVKHAARVNETQRIPEYVDRAFRIAHAGTPGPVYLELPVDVLAASAADEPPPTSPLLPPRPAAPASSIEQSLELLSSAERPCFIVGSELRWSPVRDRLPSLADSLKVPFLLNGMARGALSAEHPQLFALARMHALKRSDVVAVLGTPLDFRLDFGRGSAWADGCRVIQVDTHAEELGRNRSVDLAVLADCGLYLQQLAERWPHAKTETWLQELRQVEQNTQQHVSADSEPASGIESCSARDVAEVLASRLGPEDTVVGDGGGFVRAVSQRLPLSWPQLWLDAGPLGTLGVGTGFSMAAKLLRPQSRVWALFGDGAFGLSALDFEALARQEIELVAVVGNNARWGETQRTQLKRFGPERLTATALSPARYDQAVEALGGRGFWVERRAELAPAIDAAAACGRPALVNVRLK